MFFTDTTTGPTTGLSSQWVDLTNPFSQAFTVTVTTDPNSFLVVAGTSGDVVLNDNNAHDPLYTDYVLAPGAHLKLNLKSKFNADFIKTYKDADIPIQKTNLYFTITLANGSIRDEAVDLFYMPDYADGNATDGLWTFMDTMDGKTRTLSFDNAAHVELKETSDTYNLFGVSQSGGIVQGLTYTGRYVNALPDFATYQVEEGGRKLGTIKVAGYSVPKQTVGVSLATLRTMVQNIRTEAENYKNNPLTAVVHDPTGFAAGKYNIFLNLFPDAVITDAQWQDVVDGFNEWFGTGASAIYQNNIAQTEFSYGETGLNPIVMINQPWVNTVAKPDPNDDASRSFAGLDFAYNTFESTLTKAGAGAGSFGGMVIRDDISIASKRYLLSRVVNPERAGAMGGQSAMTLVVDGILRAYLSVGFTRKDMGRSYGWVVGHELAHNMGLFDEYIYSPFTNAPRDGGANFMSNANNIRVSSSQAAALHLAMDNPDTTVALSSTDALLSWYLDLDALDKSNRAGRQVLNLSPLAGDGEGSTDPLGGLLYFVSQNSDATSPVTSSPILISGASHDGIVNGQFSVADPAATDYGWITEGDAKVSAGAGVLTEDPRLASRFAQTFVVPADAATLRFQLVSSHFVANGDGPPDAFEVALIGADGKPVGGTLPLSGSDALFNLQADGTVYAADQVSAAGLTNRNGGTFPSGRPITVSIDLTGVAAGTTVTLYFDLLGFGEAASSVTVDNVRLLKVGEVEDQPPVANADTAAVDEDASVLVNVLANDTDPEGKALTLVSADGATHGAVTLENGQVRYTPSANYFGADSFTYVVRDEAGNTATTSVAITVRPVNDAPVANPDSVAVLSGGSVLIDVLANDTDIDSPVLTITGATGASHGTVAIESGKVRYTPDAGYAGGDSFTYTITDGDGGNAGSSVTVDILVHNTPPVANADTAVTDEDTPILIDALANDTDAEGQALSLVSVGLATHGTVSLDAGQIRYVPDADWFGADSFTYVMQDSVGAQASATVNVTVNSVNDPPVANPDSATVEASQSVLIDVLANDTDKDSAQLAVTAVSGAAHGTVVIESGQVRYTANAGFTGADSFTYTVSDGDGASVDGSVAITVQLHNTAPVAHADSAVTDEDHSVLIDVLGNDSDAEGQVLSLVSVTGATHGTLAIEGNQVRYTPDADWNGADSFTYVVADSLGATAKGAVDVTVTPVNDAPTLDALADAAVKEGDSFTVTAVGHDVDAGDVLNYALDAAPQGAKIDPLTGALTWKATDGDAAYAFTVRVSDLSGGTTTRSFTVNVANVAPTLQAGGLPAVYAGQSYTLELSSSDPGDDTLSLWHINWGDGQVQDVAGNPGQITHTYDGSVLGQVQIRATATDEDGSYALDPLAIAVLPVPLQVRSFTSDSNGFAVRFNDPFDASVINLYDSTLSNLGVSDVVLSGSGGSLVKGSLVFDADGKGLRFLATGSGLAADTYSLVLKSGPLAFHSAFGALDGNGDGTGGDDYTTRFTIGPVPALRLSLPDFVRGPGQSVDVPATGKYLPLSLSSAGDVRNLSFTVRFDPSLLAITGAVAGAGLPSGASLNVDTSVAGQITVTIASATPIAAGKLTLVNLVARVPDTAAYGAVEVVDIGNVFANQTAADRADDDALHVVGYIGDGNRNAKLDKDDVTLLQRNSLKLDSGLAAWSYIDPLLIGDIDGDGKLTTADASRVAQKIAGVARPEIPDVPAGLKVNFATAPTPPTAPVIDFGSSFAGFTVGSSDPKFKKENWKKAFVTNMATSSTNPNANLKVTVDASVQSTTPA
ncbi:MAG TPA: Ig-like domain-containing protein [Rhodocyclaceae bacterium]|nr:Ig-like domain-containing protein [Rhodocyclaceae bacterium]